MTYPAFGGGGGNGFVVGPADNIFGATSGSVTTIPLTVLPAANRAAAEAVRDAYATGHAGWLSEYDLNPGIGIYLYYSSGGDEVLTAQVRIDGAWRDTSAAVGIPGVPGPAGDSLRYSFAGVADRDAFYSLAGNRAGLTNGVTITVTENGIAFTQIWTGATNPPAYDPTLFQVASIGTAPGSLFLGEGGQRISGGFNVLNIDAPGGKTSYLQAINYTAAGSTAPFFYKLGAAVNSVVADVFSSTITSPAPAMTFGPTPVTSYATQFTIRPATSGKLRVQSFQGATPTGPSILDVYYTIPPSAIGTAFAITITNPTMKLDTDTTTLVFSGISLFGGLQTTGLFSGQTVPYLEATVLPATPVGYITADSQYLQDVTAGRKISINKANPLDPVINWSSSGAFSRSLSIYVDEINEETLDGSTVVFDNTSGSLSATLNTPDLPVGWSISIGNISGSGSTGTLIVAPTVGMINGFPNFTAPANTMWRLVYMGADDYVIDSMYFDPSSVIVSASSPSAGVLRVTQFDGDEQDITIIGAAAGALISRRNSAAQSVSSGTQFRIGFDTADTDYFPSAVGLTYDGVTNIGRFTNATAEQIVVEVSYQVVWANSAAGLRYSWIRFNGQAGDRLAYKTQQSSSATEATAMSGTATLRIDPAQFFEIYVQHSAGISLQTGGAVGGVNAGFGNRIRVVRLIP